MLFVLKVMIGHHHYAESSVHDAPRETQKDAVNRLSTVRSDRAAAYVNHYIFKTLLWTFFWSNSSYKTII
jgi:hypothetical protein